MPWTPEQRRRHAPAISDAVRANATVRLATMIDALDPPARTGRPRLWSTLTMLQAPWWLCRAGAAWKLLPAIHPPRQTVGSRLERWIERDVLDRALAVLNGCLRLARGRKRRPSAGILDTQSVKTGPQRGPRGFDAGKQVKGRKRVLLVDTEGRRGRVVPGALEPGADASQQAPASKRAASPTCSRRTGSAAPGPARCCASSGRRRSWWRRARRRPPLRTSARSCPASGW
jgi:transposase